MPNAIARQKLYRIEKVLRSLRDALPSDADRPDTSPKSVDPEIRKAAIKWLEFARLNGPDLQFFRKLYPDAYLLLCEAFPLKK